MVCDLVSRARSAALYERQIHAQPFRLAFPRSRRYPLPRRLVSRRRAVEQLQPDEERSGADLAHGDLPPQSQRGPAGACAGDTNELHDTAAGDARRRAGDVLRGDVQCGL